jgi:hypothetical protein
LGNPAGKTALGAICTVFVGGQAYFKPISSLFPAGGNPPPLGIQGIGVIPAAPL